MPAQYFTLEEANALLPTIRPLMARLLERRALIAQKSATIGAPIDDLYSGVGNIQTSQLLLDFAAFEALVGKIQSCGCVVKDVNGGLVDFLAEIEGRDVYLCWRYNEPRIAYYHTLEGGFQGRRRLP